MKIKAFPIFVACFFATWGIVLLLLKYIGGLDRVGCAAGGEPLDVKLLRDIGFRRWQRRRIIQRSWRLQSVFVTCSIAVIALSFVFANRGLTPYMESLDDVNTISSLVQTRTRHSLHLGHLLSTHMAALRPFLDFNISSLCPNYEQTFLETEFSLSSTSTEIAYAADQLNYFFDADLETFLVGFDQIADTCKSVDEIVAKAQSNDWIVRLVLASLNVINVFLLLGVVLTRNKIRSTFYQDVLAYVFLPVFVVVIIFVVAMVCMAAANGMVIAGKTKFRSDEFHTHFSVAHITDRILLLVSIFSDFCSGEDNGPISTMAEIVTMSGYKRAKFVSKVANYFSVENCQSPDPLLFLRDLRVSMVEASVRVEDVSREIQGANFAQLSAQCGSDFAVVNSTFFNMVSPLSDVTLTIERLDDLATCEYIQPVLEDVVYGAICNETLNAATWMCFTSLVLAVLTFIMLSTRASLFNTLIPGPKKKRREKEFKQYKKFMEEHGFETSDWVLDPPKKTDLVVETNTFETSESSDSLSMIQITPEPKYELPEKVFADEHEQDESRRKPPSESELSNGFYQDTDEEREKDTESVLSADSDDSSVNPPQTVISEVASTVSARISSATRRFRRWSYTRSPPSTGVSSEVNAQRHTPRKSPLNLLGLLDQSVGESEFEDSEILPLSPLPEPPAPQKRQKSLRRTRGASDLEM